MGYLHCGISPLWDISIVGYLHCGISPSLLLCTLVIGDSDVIMGGVDTPTEGCCLDTTGFVPKHPSKLGKQATRVHIEQEDK